MTETMDIPYRVDSLRLKLGTDGSLQAVELYRWGKSEPVAVYAGSWDAVPTQWGLDDMWQLYTQYGEAGVQAVEMLLREMGQALPTASGLRMTLWRDIQDRLNALKPGYYDVTAEHLQAIQQQMEGQGISPALFHVGCHLLWKLQSAKSMMQGDVQLVESSGAQAFWQRQPGV